MAATQERVMELLRGVKYPGFSRDIVSFGIVRAVTCGEANVEVRLQFPESPEETQAEIRAAVIDALRAVTPNPSVTVEPPTRRPVRATRPSPLPIPGVRSVIAVAGASGGVGASALAVNLALAHAAEGHKTGVLDANLYAPAVPAMLGLRARPVVNDENRIIPPVAYGLRVMSYGLIVEPDDTTVWRGAMASNAIGQFLREVEWGGLEALWLDLPPGAGDIHLAVTQGAPLAGVAIVTAPHDRGGANARRAAARFAQAGVRVLGLVENMSGIRCPRCGTLHEPFAAEERPADGPGLPLLGQIPLDPAAFSGGAPPLVARPDSGFSRAVRDLAARIRSALPPPSPPPERLLGR